MELWYAEKLTVLLLVTGKAFGFQWPLGCWCSYKMERKEKGDTKDGPV